METTATQQLTNNGSTRSAARNRILSARLSEAEYAALEKQAQSKGKTIADWAREVLARGIQSVDKAALGIEIFTELVAIELVMMNALEPVLRGEKLSHEQAARIFREVQATKAARAQELLAKRGLVRRK